MADEDGGALDHCGFVLYSGFAASVTANQAFRTRPVTISTWRPFPSRCEQSLAWLPIAASGVDVEFDPQRSISFAPTSISMMRAGSATAAKRQAPLQLESE